MDEKEDKVETAMQMLFSAKWNLPYAANFCELSYKNCKEKFKGYCETHPPTWRG